ncbi:MAG: iron(III) transport system permease protein [Spirochaetes bacterium]|nr:MAG: iron(III) transport system permease protein [Spirochaetota bacterium]
MIFKRCAAREDLRSEPARRLLARRAGAILPLVLVLLPLGALVSAIAGEGGLGVWFEGRFGLILEYAAGSLASALVAASLAWILGTSLAWLAAFYDFPFRRFLSFFAALPLAVPAYLAVYAHAGFLDITGPISRGLRGAVPDSAFRLAPGGTLWLGIVLGFQLYPYVYLIVYPALRRGLRSPLDAARVLGREGFCLFLRPGLSLARPFSAAGALLVAMEALNEYGAAAYLGAPTLTSGLVRAWSHAFDIGAAASIALLLAGLALLLVAAEKAIRGRGRYASSLKSAQRGASFPRTRPRRAWLFSLLFILAATPGLAVPLIQSAWWILLFPRDPGVRLFSAVGGSLFIILVAGGLALLGGLASLLLFRAFGGSPRRSGLMSFSAKAGYAVPAVVLALGFVRLGGGALAGFVSGLALLVAALTARFMGVAYGGLEAAWSHRVEPYRAPAELASPSAFARIRGIYTPLLRPAIFSTGLLVALDLVKELGASLLLRPLGFESLATYAYEQASQELPHLTALPGLAIVALSGLVVWRVYKEYFHEV